jgi:acylphosphatase
MSESENVRLFAIVKGRVQGVGFRAFVNGQAVKLGITGWVRNRWDGTVEVLAEGERQQLDQLVVALHRGPRSSYVTAVNPTWETATGEFSTFRVSLTYG